MSRISYREKKPRELGGASPVAQRGGAPRWLGLLQEGGAEDNSNIEPNASATFDLDQAGKAFPFANKTEPRGRNKYYAPFDLSASRHLEHHPGNSK